MIVSKCLFSTSVLWAFTIGFWSRTTRHESVRSELSDSSHIRAIGELVRNGDAYTSPTYPIVLKLMQFSGDCFTLNLFWGKARYSKDLFNTSSNNEQFHCSWNRPFSGLIVVKSLLSWAFPQTCEASVCILCSFFRYEHEAADIKSLMSFSQKVERMDIEHLMRLRWLRGAIMSGKSVLAGRFIELAWPMGGVYRQYQMGVAFQELLCIPLNNVFFLNSVTKGI